MSKEKKPGNIFIIHFQPLERFPPVINLLDYLGNNAHENITVITTRNKKGGNLKPYFNESDNIKIYRTPSIIPKSFFRLINYTKFYLYSLFFLIRKEPASVLYFETLSSWPALIYKKLRGNRVKLLLHCHEYTSLENYNDMWLVKKMHRIETKMYPYAYEWISHTNEVRLEQFKKDHSLQKVNGSIFHTLPNYPSKSWASYKNEFGSDNKIRLVFAGSLGYDTMYLQEIVEWVLWNKNFFSLDIFAYNIDEKAKGLLDSIPESCIKYYKGHDYKELPGILKNYDIGLVLYRPYNFNHINGVSNKVYEYLACGLDVWFPQDNTFMLTHVREKAYPKIIALNFKNLSNFDFEKAVKREGVDCMPYDYFYENVYEEIYKNMITAS